MGMKLFFLSFFFPIPEHLWRLSEQSRKNWKCETFDELDVVTV